MRAGSGLTPERNTSFDHSRVWLHLRKPHRREDSLCLSLLLDLYVFVVLLPPCEEWKIASDRRLLFARIGNATVRPSGGITNGTTGGPLRWHNSSLGRNVSISLSIRWSNKLADGLVNLNFQYEYLSSGGIGRRDVCRLSKIIEPNNKRK